MLSFNRNKFTKILQHNLCIGCGLCETIGIKEGYIMNLKENGFYKPEYNNKRNPDIEKKISKICPGINLTCPESKDIWGNVNGLYKAWSNDPEVRKKGSSGGAISALCIFLIENKIVDGILQVGKAADHFMYNELFVSRSRSEVLLNASSRYAPAKVFNELTNIFETSEENFAFVGKPCDIAGLQNYLFYNPQYDDRIKYFLAIFCAGIPSYNATLKLLEQAKKKEFPFFVKYRGNGWPGIFEAKYKDGEVFRVQYEESWGYVLGKYIHFRCKICPDSIGLMADIAFGDAWEVMNGRPVFEEKDGKSFMISRTLAGNNLINAALCGNIITTENLGKREIAEMQPYQYERRLMVGYRIIIIQLLTFSLLKLKNTGYLKLIVRNPTFKGIRNSLGTLRRFFFNHNN